VTLSGTLALREGTFTNDDWLFVCQSLQNVVITLTGEAQHSTEYNFLVGHEKYKIKFDLSPHNISGTDLTEKFTINCLIFLMIPPRLAMPSVRERSRAGR
jgi:hypothetical protein